MKSSVGPADEEWDFRHGPGGLTERSREESETTHDGSDGGQDDHPGDDETRFPEGPHWLDMPHLGCGLAWPDDWRMPLVPSWGLPGAAIWLSGYH
jgi:hypothetical protein